MREREWIGGLPPKMRHLPVDHRGFPVPYFVAWQDGKPLFPVMDPAKMRDAIRFSNCWVCGQRLGAHKAFVIGPMCVCNRLNSEPPSHLECALFSAKNCPFLTKPRMRRQVTHDGTYLDQPVQAAAGIMIERNPGVCCVWVTKKFEIERTREGPLFRLGDPETVSFWAEGRRATRAEVDESVRTGLPILQQAAEEDGRDAVTALQRKVSDMTALLERLPWPQEAAA